MAQPQLKGRRFGRWRVLALESVGPRGGTKWRVKCSCERGTVRILPAGELMCGNATNCGCQHVVYDMTGKRFGSLIVERKDGRGWACRCACGNMHWATGENLRSGRIKSCGCTRYAPRVAGIGERFGRLTVIAIKKNNRRMVRCSCEKRTEFEITAKVMMNKADRGGVPSCGCVPGKNQRPINGWSTGSLYLLARKRGVTLSAHVIERRLMAGESPLDESFWRPRERWAFKGGKDGKAVYAKAP